MGRRGLGVSTAQYRKMPHNPNGPSAGLWWYQPRPGSPSWAINDLTKNTQAVIDEYVRRASRGRTPEKDFKQHLQQWLHDLSREQKLTEWDKPRTKRYWTVDAYARANKLEPPTLMARVRKLEKIAKELFPERIPAEQKDVVLSEGTIAKIRARYVEIIETCFREGYPFDDHKRAVAIIVEKFGIKPFRVGQICKAEKENVKSKAPTADEQPTAAVPSSDFLDPFSS